jgi:hypothetical protein
MKVKIWLLLFVVLCSSCSSIKTNKVKYVEDTPFGSHPITANKPSLAKRIWTRMNPLYNSEWGTGKKIIYFLSPVGH